MGRLIRWLKVKTRKSRLFIYKNCTPEVQRGVLKDEFIFYFFGDPFSCCPPLPFIVILLFFQLSCYQPDLRGYLSHQHLPLPFFDHENGLLGVFSLFKLVIQHSMWLHQVRRALNVDVIVTLGSAFSSMYLSGKQVKMGDPRLSKWLLLDQTTCSSGRQVSRITSIMGPNCSSLNGRLVHPFSTPRQSPFHGWGFLGLSPRVKILGEDFQVHFPSMGQF